MGTKKDKLIRKNVRNLVGDYSQRYLLVMLDSPLLIRLRWAVVIIFRLGYKDLITRDKE